MTTRAAPFASRFASRFVPRLAALVSAGFLTLAMLTGVNALATSDTTAPQWAQAAAAQKA